MNPAVMRRSRSSFVRRRPARAGRVVLAAALLALAGSAARGEEVWVKRGEQNVLAGKAATYPVVVTATKGAKLTVVAHEGNWLKVQAGDAQGYVFAESVSPREVKGGGNFFRSVAGAPDSGALGNAAAARGLVTSSSAYAKTNNLNPALLERMISDRRAVEPNEWLNFVRAGRVGPEKP